MEFSKRLQSSCGILSGLMLLCGLLNACDAEFLAKNEDMSAPLAVESVLDTSSGISVSAVQPSATLTQEIKIEHESKISGTSISFPPGSLAVATSISVEEGASLVTDLVLQELTNDTENSAQPASSAVVVSAENAVTLSGQIQITIPLTAAGGLRLAESETILAVMYRRVDESGQAVNGIIPSNEVKLDGKSVVFATKYFGSFQVISLAKPIVKEVKEVQSAAPILTKNDEIRLEPLQILILKFVPRGDLASATVETDLSIDKVSQCRMIFDQDRLFPWDRSIALELKAGAKPPVIDYAKVDLDHFSGQLDCLDINGFAVQSPWSNPIKFRVNDLKVSGIKDPTYTLPVSSPQPFLAGLILKSEGGGVLDSATAKITSGFAKGKDFLELRSNPGLRAEFNADRSEIKISGYASVTAYQQALRQIAFKSFASTSGKRTIAMSIGSGANVQKGDLTVTLEGVAGFGFNPSDDEFMAQSTKRYLLDVLANDGGTPPGSGLTLKGFSYTPTAGLQGAKLERESSTSNLLLYTTPWVNKEAFEEAGDEGVIDTFTYKVSDGINDKTVKAKIRIWPYYPSRVAAYPGFTTDIKRVGIGNRTFLVMAHDERGLSLFEDKGAGTAPVFHSNMDRGRMSVTALAVVGNRIYTAWRGPGYGGGTGYNAVDAYKIETFPEGGAHLRYIGDYREDYQDPATNLGHDYKIWSIAVGSVTSGNNVVQKLFLCGESTFGIKSIQLGVETGIENGGPGIFTGAVIEEGPEGAMCDRKKSIAAFGESLYFVQAGGHLKKVPLSNLDQTPTMAGDDTFSYLGLAVLGNTLYAPRVRQDSGSVLLNIDQLGFTDTSFTSLLTQNTSFAASYVGDYKDFDIVKNGGTATAYILRGIDASNTSNFSIFSCIAGQSDCNGLQSPWSVRLGVGGQNGITAVGGSLYTWSSDHLYRQYNIAASGTASIELPAARDVKAIAAGGNQILTSSFEGASIVFDQATNWGQWPVPVSRFVPEYPTGGQVVVEFLRGRFFSFAGTVLSTFKKNPNSADWNANLMPPRSFSGGLYPTSMFLWHNQLAFQGSNGLSTLNFNQTTDEPLFTNTSPTYWTASPFLNNQISYASGQVISHYADAAGGVVCFGTSIKFYTGNTWTAPSGQSCNQVGATATHFVVVTNNGYNAELKFYKRSIDHALVPSLSHGMPGNVLKIAAANKHLYLLTNHGIIVVVSTDHIAQQGIEFAVENALYMSSAGALDFKIDQGGNMYLAEQRAGFSIYRDLPGFPSPPIHIMPSSYEPPSNSSASTNPPSGNGGAQMIGP